MAALRLTWAAASVTVELRDTPTARQLLAAVPFDAPINTWGEELYFTTPVKAALEADARQVVEPGTVCFWVDGDALALPWGRTPISAPGECRLVSPCNVLGQLREAPDLLATARDGETVRVESV